MILISGKKRSGKDYVASLLKEKFESCYNYEIVSFAGKLKEIIANTFDISIDKLNKMKNEPECYPINFLHEPDDITFIEKTTNMRKILQRFGTEGIKPVFGDNIWAELIEGSNRKIIPDFRFPEEYQTIKSNFGEVVTVFVEGGETNDNHSSETALKDFNFDFIIDNREKNDISDQIEILVNFIKDRNIPTKYYYSERMFNEDIEKMVEAIRKTNVESITAIHRGSLIPGVILSHKLKIPLNVIDFQRLEKNSKEPVLVIDNNKPSTALIDDIYDTGETMNKCMKLLTTKGIKTFPFVLFSKSEEVYHLRSESGWIIFPWEKS